MKLIKYGFGIILFFTVSLTQAQSFKGGLVLGLAATQVTGDKLSGYNHPGVQAGVFTELPFGKKNALRMEMYYIQKGSRKNSTVTNPGSYVQRLNYVEVPLFYSFKPFNKLGFRAGVSFAYLFWAIDRIDGDKVRSNSVDTRNPFDFSVQGGGTWQFNDKWNLGLTYSYSFLPIRDLPSFSTMAYHDRRQYNDVVLISLFRYL